ncbi:MAG: asparagine synthase (glutamine-hydrolyzing) [Bacteroidota bacterium]
MCGITGIFNIDKKPIPLGVLKHMTDVIQHRGPDGEGFWNEGYIGFGHRRLSIIDLSPGGHQPMMSTDGRYIITYNGEVYNFQQLRVELEKAGQRFHSDSDTEVVINAFAEWGEKAILRFNGMFAFALWDTHEKRLWLVRDRYGIKPLYYFFDGKTLVFGSEIKSIIQHPAYQTRVSIEALNEYFSFQNIFSDLTLFENVKLLQPATYLTFELDKGLTKQHMYWDYDFEEQEKFSSEEEYIEELDRLFSQAVNRQLISDVEVGSFLSGGMDSGGITCIAANNFKNLKTFTAGFDLTSASGLELGFDERGKAEFLSSLYKTEHYEVVLKSGDMERVMPELIWHLEDLRVGQSYPNFYVNRLASKFVKVVLSGTGGDELFAGYPWRYYMTVVNEDAQHYAEKYYRYWQRLIPDSYKPKFYQQDIYPRIWNYQTKDIFTKVLNVEHPYRTPEQYINHSLYFEIKTFMHGLLMVEDKLSLAHSLETRVPFLDNDLVDFAMKVPIRYKLKNLGEVVRINENEPGQKTRKYFEKTNDGKILLRKALEKYVPLNYTEGIKQGFSAPDASWFKGESIDYIRNLLFDKKARIYDYIQPEFAHELMNEHFSGQNNRRLLIWSLLSFEWWLKTFMK